jgi:hypothetical protein
MDLKFFLSKKFKLLNPKFKKKFKITKDMKHKEWSLIIKVKEIF